MSRKKLVRFAELQTMSNVVDGRRCERGWFKKRFGTDRSVVMELGCGRGEVSLALAAGRPEIGVLAVDRNGARLWKGARRALDDGVANVVFLRSLVEHLDEHVPEGRIAEIWLAFPDPLPKKRQAKHRLLAERFLRLYRHLLVAGGAIHLKTDDADLAAWAEEAVRAAGGSVADREDDLQPGSPGAGILTVQTTYERRHRAEGRRIFYRKFLLG